MTTQIQRPRRISYNLVWDVGTLLWVEMTQPTSGGGSSDATAANQVLGNASVSSIDSKTPALVGGRVPVDPSGVTSPVSLATLPALVAGTANIGDVDVLTLPALVAGTALIGKVGIDQTTPGTTNKVSIGTDGTVAINTALPAGSNAIGKLAANSGVDIGDVDVTSLPAITGTVTANAGTNLNTSLLSTAAKQDTGNTSLGSIKTNTDPLVTAAAGGYVQQDSNATIAKESGGNLATVATNSALQATAAKQDTAQTTLTAILAAQPSTLTLDGETVAFSTDWANRRLAEAQFLQGITNTIHTMIGSESENSQRAGYELR